MPKSKKEIHPGLGREPIEVDLNSRETIDQVIGIFFDSNDMNWDSWKEVTERDVVPDYAHLTLRAFDECIEAGNQRLALLMLVYGCSVADTFGDDRKYIKDRINSIATIFKLWTPETGQEMKSTSEVFKQISKSTKC